MDRRSKQRQKRIRDWLGLAEDQWIVFVSLLLVLPYPVFIAAYLFLEFTGPYFLLTTLLYSLFAIAVSFLT